MQANPVGWFEIYVQDMKRAKTFYETVFPFHLEKLDTPDLDYWAFPMNKETGGCGGALVKMEGVTSGNTSVIIYFTSADCSIEAAKVVKAGGKIHKEKFSIGQYGYIALVYDTEGNMFGIHSME